MPAAALALAGCGSATTRKINTTGIPSNPADRSTYEQSVAFEKAYEARWHVSKDTADCVKATTQFMQGQRWKMGEALHVNWRHLPGGACS